MQENFILINRQTAEELGIVNGAQMIVATRVGKVQGRAKVTEGIRPDTVAISYHYGQQSKDFPEYARQGIWVNSILENHSDVASGMTSFNDGKCRLYKV